MSRAVLFLKNLKFEKVSSWANYLKNIFLGLILLVAD